MEIGSTSHYSYVSGSQTSSQPRRHTSPSCPESKKSSVGDTASMVKKLNVDRRRAVKLESGKSQWGMPVNGIFKKLDSEKVNFPFLPIKIPNNINSPTPNIDPATTTTTFPILSYALPGCAKPPFTAAKIKTETNPSTMGMIMKPIANAMRDLLRAGCTRSATFSCTFRRLKKRTARNTTPTSITTLPTTSAVRTWLEISEECNA
ncbi:hypothetical protein BC830DRAFT_1139672 [Chytriomyces sp. MP71]|nr:hypothetical protein BC830DRAFT_1139672 [Chytriomyces sp. MP71]